MSFDGEENRWMCGRSVNLQKVSSIVRDIREPCLHSPRKGGKMLKPDKWQAIFDHEGKVLSFRKALKLITLGGVDPSIRAEVWEFLLGVYTLSSTAEHRRQLRMARRERYEELVRRCQSMHSSIGTGTLAYVVGSKVMDMRTSSKDDDAIEALARNRRASDDATGNSLDAFSHYNNDTHLRKCSSSHAELVTVRNSIEGAAYDNSYLSPSSGEHDCFSTAQETEMYEPQYAPDSFFTNLFQNSDTDECGTEMHDFGGAPRYDDDHMHSFQINNNVDLIMESNMSSNSMFNASNGDNEIFSSSKELRCNSGTGNGLRCLDAPETHTIDVSLSNGQVASEDRVSEWLWMLHRIVVDVVRTDSHLEFYEDAKNIARMSDILAVYAWIDPATGYCQGMSDLLSPFVVLYENNADAFWCFEMLLRRMRANFQMEGPTGVMKQLEALWKILELTDAEMFEHLSAIGAESLHFAFRMLLVLFRRELSFNEALGMWEMMWAADYDESMAQQLEENCLEPLVLQLKNNTSAELIKEKSENGKRKHKSPKHESRDNELCSPYSNGLKSISNHPFCGLPKANFWARDDRLSTFNASERNANELAVFCVAAILVINRQKIMRQTRSIDDLIKMFNDNKLKISVKRCIRTAIKLRKKYFIKLNKHTCNGTSDQ